jgi:hypothetical protein
MRSFNFMMTREEWLNNLTDALRPRFQDLSAPLPAKVRISCGWPSKKALARRKRVIGQCWNPECSCDQTTEVFISPVLSEAFGPQGVGATLVHELVHAAVGTAAGHKRPFSRVAKALGLEGPWTSTSATPELEELLRTLAPGEYPHATLDYTKLDGEKKQSTRLVKCECPECGYTVRTTRKWLVERGAPICPCNHEPMLGPDLEDESEEETRKAA